MGGFNSSCTILILKKHTPKADVIFMQPGCQVHVSSLHCSQFFPESEIFHNNMIVLNEHLR